MTADGSNGGETIGQRLRRLREGRGLSQRAISGPGVSYAYISRIEAGARRPSVKALRVIAGNLGVTPEYLETGFDGVLLRLPGWAAERSIWPLYRLDPGLASQVIDQLDIPADERDDLLEACRLLRDFLS